ncbi:hypothetical protein BDM02DRAFT_3190856 [Thelephora ganbajun]|uniref:Uncharacterized protein n=1 Tax=Thelephora ganbajun TaxID=370292 RepID=A0ACB6Z4D3_THEGA|nr:hypothetical protein BDM02DRAFT_3190856 [Thelephora ganbajun]
MSQAYDHTSLSSDDEELLPSIVVRTPAETRASNMRMIANLGESLNCVSVNCKAASREFGALKDALKATFACKTCGQPPSVPFVLQCGHIHCLDCLEKYLESTMRHFVTTHYCYRPPPAEYVQALREPFVDPHLYLDAVHWIQDNPTPRYQCVHCHELLTRSPVHGFYLRGVMGTLGQEMQASSSGSRSWSDNFFDRYLLF